MKRFTAAAIAAAMAVSLTACGSGSGSGSGSSAEETTAGFSAASVSIGGTSDKTETSAEAKVIDETKKREIAVGISSEPDAFVPFDSTYGTNSNIDNIMTMNVYEGCFTIMPDGSIEPTLATGYEINDDATLITIHLRDDVYFSNGDHMTAEDVAWTYTQYAQGKTKSMWCNFESAAAVDDYTVEVKLSAPYAPIIIHAIANRVGLIVDKKLFEEIGLDAYYANPVGTGPYKLTEVVTADHQTYEVNENYWGEKPFYEKITVKFLTDLNTQMLALENREIDVLCNANLAPVLKIDPGKGISYDVCMAAGPLLMSINQKAKLTSNPDFRKAIAYMVNREELSLALYEGYAEPAEVYGMPYFTGYPEPGTYEPALPEHDLDKAKEYLAKSGYNGEEFIIAVQSGQKAATAAEIIQGECMNIGINCTVKVLDGSSYSALTKTVDGYNATLTNSISASMDMVGARVLYSADYARSQNNTVHYDDNPELEALWNATDPVSDPQERAKLFGEIQGILNEDLRCIPLIKDYNITAFYDDIKGVKSRPLNSAYLFKEWY